MNTGIRWGQLASGGGKNEPKNSTYPHLNDHGQLIRKADEQTAGGSRRSGGSCDGDSGGSGSGGSGGQNW